MKVVYRTKPKRGSLQFPGVNEGMKRQKQALFEHCVCTCIPLSFSGGGGSRPFEPGALAESIILTHASGSEGLHYV